MPIPLIRTKLHRPPVARDHLHRQSLLDRLDARQHRPLTLVSAPAGYGKTTLTSCWLEASEVPSAWVSLDETDNDLRTFLAYFLSAVQGIFPDAALETRAMLNSPEIPKLTVLAPNLINELDQIKDNFILVLDDYHLIKDKEVQDLLIELLKHPPASLHLVLIGRRDPALPLTVLRARNQMTEIRVQDLCLSVEETVTFLRRALDLPLDKATASILKEKTEGWITGLRLATLSLRHRSDMNRIVANLPEESQFVTDYLLNEVLLSQPEDFREYLLATAMLSRFCAPLCDAMCVPGTRLWECKIGGEQFLKWLQGSDLFVVPLDDQGRWFRYHHLFQQLLQDRLKREFSPDDRTDQYKRASAWFDANGLVKEALDYAFKGGDTDTAIRLVIKYRHDLMNRERWHHLRQMMKLLPSDALERVPELILLDAWMQWHQMQIVEMIKRLDLIEPRLAAIDPQTTETEELNGECNIMRGLQYYLAPPFNARKVLNQAQQAIQRVPRNRTSQRGLAIILLAHAYQAEGRLNKACSAVFEALSEKEYHNTTYHGRLLMTLGFIHWMEADLIALEEVGRQILNLKTRFDFPEAHGVARYFLGISHYCRNELSQAEKELAPIVMAADKVSIFNFSHSIVALALTYQAQGRPVEANHTTAMLVSYALETNNQPLLQMGYAFQAELDLRQGNVAKASRWASGFDPEPFRTTNRIFLPQPVLAKVLLAQNTPESLQQAAGLLSRLQDFYTAIHNRRFLIDVLLLQGLLHEAQGEEPEALAAIERAIFLAEPGGFMRPFMDLGSAMAGLLNRLAKQQTTTKYVGRLLAAFRKEGAGYPGTSIDDQSAAPLPVVDPFINETLSRREIDIITLLAQRLRNREIAEKLFISPLTVKKHAMNIYRKLNVNSRQNAVEKAKALGIL
jgi:LuxR family maltose regulon positive regulatory protein